MDKLYASKNGTIVIEECEGLPRVTDAAPVVVITRRRIGAVKIPRGQSHGG